MINCCIFLVLNFKFLEYNFFGILNFENIIRAVDYVSYRIQDRMYLPVQGTGFPNIRGDY